MKSIKYLVSVLILLIFVAAASHACVFPASEPETTAVVPSAPAAETQTPTSDEPVFTLAQTSKPTSAPTPETTPQPTPEVTPTPAPAVVSYTATAGCSDSSFLIDGNGVLWAWGNNGEGQLGDDTTENRTAPVRIMEDVNAVSGGYHTMYAIKEDGSLWAWGYSGQGCNFKYESAVNSFVPIKIMEKVIAVSTNGNDAVAIKDDNSLWIWGFDAFYYFYLLDPAKTEEIKIMEGVQKISAGLFHFMALDQNGTVWTFGASNYGELGNGVAGQTLTYKPQRVMDGVVNISAGVDHSLALKEGGSLWAWGRNDFGQLGDGTYENRSRPVKVMDDVAAVSAGSKFTAAIKKDGTLWAWGNNPPRMYAAAHINKCNTPQQVFSDKNQENPVYASAVSGGDNHMLITARDGRLLASGEDNYGQLGDGGGEWFLGSDADEDWNEIHLVEVLMPEG